MADKLEAVFSLEKETKNTKRFAEEPSRDGPPIMNTLYVQKWACANLGNPAKIRVTITVEA